MRASGKLNQVFFRSETVVPLILILLPSVVLLYFIPVRFQVKALLSPALQIIQLDLKLLYGLFSFTHKYNSDDNQNYSKDRKYNSDVRTSNDKSRGEKNGGSDDPQHRKSDLPQLSDFWDRVKDYGLGIALLSLFIKNKYIHWVASFSAAHSQTKCLHLRWVTVLGLEDAAITAVATGASYALSGLALGYLQQYINFGKCKKHQISILPSYDQPKLETDFYCILELKIGHIIAAGFRNYLRHFLRKEGVQSNERASY